MLPKQPIRPVNPFRVGEIVTGDSYCERPEAEKALAKLLKAKHRVLLKDERRTGKTSLTQEVARKYFGNRMVRVALTPAPDSSEIASALLTGWGNFIQQTSKNWMDRLIRQGLDFSVDLKVLKINPKAAGPMDGIAQFFSLLDGEKRKPILFFDEFQFAAELPVQESSKFFWSLRDGLQSRPNIPVVFAGSDRNRLADIFFHGRNPFYNTVQVPDLPAIDPSRMRTFIGDRFARGGLVLTEEGWAAVMDYTRGIPGYIQELCLAIWDVAKGRDIDSNAIDAGITRILRQYNGFRDLVNLTPLQLRFGHGIAILEPDSVTTSEFLEFTKLKSSSSALRPRKLFEEDLNVIEKREGRYRFYNPFMREWFRRQRSHPI